MSNSSSIFRALLKFGLKLGAVGAGAAAAAIAYSHYVEPFDIRMDHLTIRVPNAAGRLPKQGLRILHLSDSHFHGGSRTAREREKINLVRRMTEGLEYDLLVHTGDFIHDNEGVGLVIELLDAVPKPKLGSYGVFGNHDYAHFDMGVAPKRMWKTYNDRNPLPKYSPFRLAKHLLDYIVYFRNTPLDGPPVQANDPDRLQRALEAWGMEVLHNRSRHLVNEPSLPASMQWAGSEAARNGGSRRVETHQGGGRNGISSTITTTYKPPVSDKLDLYLAGVDDWCMGEPSLLHALRDVPEDAPVILLSHNPDVIEDSNLHRADFVISGHTHGGQLVVPVWGPAHTQSATLGRHEAAGYIQRGRTQIYVSRGLGEGIPLRFMAHPQIALITVTA